jgi:hypothetical protein
MTTATATGTVYFVIACGGAKQATPTAACDLYTGSAFRHMLTAAMAEAAATTADLGVDAKVLILSAEHGLLELDQVVAPYDRRMGDRGAVDWRTVTCQLVELGVTTDDEVYAMLPKAYLRVLTQAGKAEDIAVQDVYEAAPGIGFQRGVASALIRHS